MHMTCLDNTQAYNAFVFVIIKDNTLKYMLHLDLFHLCFVIIKTSHCMSSTSYILTLSHVNTLFGNSFMSYDWKMEL